MKKVFGILTVCLMAACSGGGSGSGGGSAVPSGSEGRFTVDGTVTTMEYYSDSTKDIPECTGSPNYKLDNRLRVGSSSTRHHRFDSLDGRSVDAMGTEKITRVTSNSLDKEITMTMLGQPITATQHCSVNGCDTTPAPGASLDPFKGIESDNCNVAEPDQGKSKATVEVGTFTLKSGRSFRAVRVTRDMEGTLSCHGKPSGHGKEHFVSIKSDEAPNLDGNSCYKTELFSFRSITHDGGKTNNYNAETLDLIP